MEIIKIHFLNIKLLTYCLALALFTAL